MTKPESIRLLNQAVADELHAVHQYMYFHFHLDDQGFMPLSNLFKMIAIQEMGHVELLAERILFLKGDVEMVSADSVEKITNPEAILLKAMAMEESSAKFYNQAAIECGQKADAATKQIFEKLVGDEEGHFDQFERQHENVKRFGLSYLALQSYSGASQAAGGAAD